MDVPAAGEESSSSLFEMASELGSPTPAAKRTIMDIGDDLLREVFIRLPSLPSLVRAALACPAFLHAIRSSPAFRRRFQALHPPQLLGFFLDHCRIPQFFPLHGRCDPDHTAVIRHADFFLTRLMEDSAHEHLGWEIQSCHGGYVILVNIDYKQIAAYNPLAEALHIFPMPPEEFGASDGTIEFHIIFSEEDLGVFRMVCVVHRNTRRKMPTCIAIISSDTMKWTGVPQPDDGGEDFLEFGVDSEFHTGRQVNALVYWKHLRQEYALVLNTTTLQICRVDLVGKGSELGHSKDGQLSMVGIDDSDPNIGNLFVCLWRPDDDGVEKWSLEYICELSTLFDADDTDDTTVHVEALIDGFVYLSANSYGVESLLSLCLETEELNTLFEYTYATLAEPYFMAWPLSLIYNKVGKLTKSKKKKKEKKRC